jgi:biotin-(acetyl-CoA carboxylase) ligase
MAVSLGSMTSSPKKIHGCSVKLPNDIYAGDKKISGVFDREYNQ